MFFHGGVKIVSIKIMMHLFVMVRLEAEKPCVCQFRLWHGRFIDFKEEVLHYVANQLNHYEEMLCHLLFQYLRNLVFLVGKNSRKIFWKLVGMEERILSICSAVEMNHRQH